MRLKIHWRLNSGPEERRALHWAARVFFVAGCCAIALCTAWYWDARVYQADALAEFRPPVEPASPSTGKAAPRPERWMPGAGNPIGKIEIQRAGVSAAIVEGVAARNLRRAVGHIPGTALPGDPGNIALAGHRDTFFRNLRRVHPGDIIRLTTHTAVYEYSVESTRVVIPSDTSDLSDADQPMLTLVTCYPFYYVGPAPRRFIVRARQITQAAF